MALVAGLLVLVTFGAHQRRTARRGRSPLVEPSLFHHRGFPAALVTSALFFAVMNGLSLVVVLHLQVGLGRDVLTAGLTLLPWSGGLAISSWIAGGYLVRRHGSRLMFAGLGVELAGVLAAIAGYRSTAPGAYPWPLLGALAVAGFGLGLFTVPFFTTALARVRPHETGSAAGLLNAVQQLGATLGVALLGTAFFDALASGPDPLTAAPTAVQHACWLAAGLLVVTAGTAGVLRSAPEGADRPTRS
jgi:MFS family permease